MIKAVIDQSGKTVENLNDKLTGEQRVIDYKTAQELKSWMLEVTKYGTGKKAYSQKAGGSAGKTGTPQISGDPEAKYYGWFAGFFPQSNPEYVVVILVRQESEGGDKAAKILKK